MRFAQIPLAALMASIAVGAAPTAAPVFPEGVGSNMIFQELGEYAARPTGENWERDVKVTLLHYHEKPDEVRARLKAMRASGQTKIGLMLWYIQEGDKRDSFSHVICPHDGRLPAQIESNIRNILKDISAASFDTVVMRMAAQGQADPLDAAYQPARAADSWKLFENLFAICESATAGTRLTILYDLGAETMGHPYSVRPGAQAFLKLMWSNYAKKYPLEKTVGFSFNHAHEPGTTESLRVFEDSGVWPGAISVDVYQEPERFLGALTKALAAFKRPDYPVIINETFRNSREMAPAFVKAKKQHAINFRFLLQWPLDKGSAGHCDNPLSAEIDAYLRATLPVSE